MCFTHTFLHVLCFSLPHSLNVLSFHNMLSYPAGPSSPISAHQNFHFLFDGPLVDNISHLWTLRIQVVSSPLAHTLFATGQSATLDLLPDLRDTFSRSSTSRYLKSTRNGLSCTPFLLPNK